MQTPQRSLSAALKTSASARCLTTLFRHGVLCSVGLSAGSIMKKSKTVAKPKVGRAPARTAAPQACSSSNGSADVHGRAARGRRPTHNTQACVFPTPWPRLNPASPFCAYLCVPVPCLLCRSQRLH